jgi:8-oxo-dGTP pyrophosphatase MutT (NUDIX family)
VVDTPGQTIVAVVVCRQGRVAVLRRSGLVRADQGLWHCVTGFMEEGTPYDNAIRELGEETGLIVPDLAVLRPGPALTLSGSDNTPWRVHTFVAEARVEGLRLNWEHDGYRWMEPEQVRRLEGQVAWLSRVLDATADVGVVRRPLL